MMPVWLRRVLAVVAALYSAWVVGNLLYLAATYYMMDVEVF